MYFFFFQAEDGIRDYKVTGVQTCALPILMGRSHGYLALMVGLAGGADVVVIPEVESDPDAVAAALRDAYARGKRHAMVVVAEGAKWNATALANYVTNHRDRIGFELRATILGHVQRGGGPG